MLFFYWPNNERATPIIFLKNVIVFCLKAKWFFSPSLSLIIGNFSKINLDLAYFLFARVEVCSAFWICHLILILENSWSVPILILLLSNSPSSLFFYYKYFCYTFSLLFMYSLQTFCIFLLPSHNFSIEKKFIDPFSCSLISHLLNLCFKLHVLCSRITIFCGHENAPLTSQSRDYI